jgi:hypothetical protein
MVGTTGSWGRSIRRCSSPLFLKEGKCRIAHWIDPFPGTLWILGWDRDRLLIESEMAITHLDDDHRPHGLCEFETPQRFAFHALSGIVEGRTPDARDPTRYFLPRLRRYLEGETDPEVRRWIEAAIAQLAE